MKQKFLNPLMLLVVISTIWGCYPGGPEYYDQYDLVYTNYDKDYSFGGQPKYAMPDKVVLVTGALASGTVPEFVSQPYSSSIISRIQSNMSKLGYVLVNDTTLADYILFPAAIKVTNVSYYDYWGYYGYYYPGGGYYYPYPVVTTYTTGTLAMTLIARNEISPTNQARAVWVGLINGLLEGSTTDWTNRINKSIDQAYDQSPYLKQN